MALHTDPFILLDGIKKAIENNKNISFVVTAKVPDVKTKPYTRKTKTFEFTNFRTTFYICGFNWRKIAFQFDNGDDNDPNEYVELCWYLQCNTTADIKLPRGHIEYPHTGVASLKQFADDMNNASKVWKIMKDPNPASQYRHEGFFATCWLKEWPENIGFINRPFWNEPTTWNEVTMKSIHFKEKTKKKRKREEE